MGALITTFFFHQTIDAGGEEKQIGETNCYCTKVTFVFKPDPKLIQPISAC